MKPAHSRALSVLKEEGGENGSLSLRKFPDASSGYVSPPSFNFYVIKVRKNNFYLWGRVASRWIHSHFFGVVGVRVKFSFIDDKP